jgi:hypothetical protein
MTASDEARAFQIASSTNLNAAVSGTIRLTFTVPDDDAWKRIRMRWGDPGYIVVVASRDGHLECFGDLVSSVSVLADERPMLVSPATLALYGYSSLCRDEGVTFRVRPGANAMVSAALKHNSADVQRRIIVMPYWTEAVKDRIVGSQLDRYRSIVVNVSGFLGTLLALWAVWPFVLSRLRSE